jgi:hypothetical protein
MTQHAPSTGLVGFPCNSNGRTADTGVIIIRGCVTRLKASVTRILPSKA